MSRRDFLLSGLPAAIPPPPFHVLFPVCQSLFYNSEKCWIIVQKRGLSRKKPQERLAAFRGFLTQKAPFWSKIDGVSEF
jgi:hypothetical protein